MAKKREPLIDEYGQYSKEVLRWQTWVLPTAKRFADHFIKRGFSRYEVSGLWQSLGEWEISRAVLREIYKTVSRKEGKR